MNLKYCCLSMIWGTWLIASRVLLLAVLILALTGCSSFWQQKPEVSPVVLSSTKERTTLYPHPSAIKVLPLKWRVLSAKQMPLSIKVLEKQRALICLTGSDYENISANMGDISRYIQQLHILVETYENERIKAAKSTGAAPGD